MGIIIGGKVASGAPQWAACPGRTWLPGGVATRRGTRTASSYSSVTWSPRAGLLGAGVL